MRTYGYPYNNLWSFQRSFQRKTSHRNDYGNSKVWYVLWGLGTEILWSSWMFVKKKGKKSFFKALYSRREGKRLLPLKILGGMPAVGSTLRRWMWGTQRRLVQWIVPRNLQRVRSNHSRTCELKINWSYLLKNQNPAFLLGWREKSKFWGAIVGTVAQNNVLGLWPYPRTLINSRRETWLRWSTL